MKHIFIGGVAKSGKSRLAKYLSQENNYNHIPIDYLASSFKHNFPEVGITSNVVIEKESSEKLALFLSRMIKGVEYDSDELYIIDSAHIMPKDIIKYLDKERWDIYYLGYKNTTAIDKLNELKENHKEGWTTKRSYEENVEIFNHLIELSKEIEKECLDNGINYIDTSNKDVLDIFK